MSVWQQVLTIGIIIAVTVFTRAIAFILFPADKPTPQYIQYLGKVLPAAALGMLAMYCFKDVSLISGNHGIPELLATAFVVALHFWKKNMFLSIAGGTALYMVLVNLVF